MRRVITGFADTDELGIRDDAVLLRSVRDAYDQLADLGVSVRIVDEGEEVSRQHLDNRIEMDEGIAADLEWEDEVAFAEQDLEDALEILAGEYPDFNWFMPEDRLPLISELRKELPSGHPLLLRELTPMARNERNDDVLFHDGEGFLVVHLTWSHNNTMPFPRFYEVEEEEIGDFLRADYLCN